MVAPHVLKFGRDSAGGEFRSMKSRKFEPQFEGGVDPRKLSACDRAESVADPVHFHGDELVDLYQRRLSKSVSLGRSDEDASD